jgi:hypothetical protein
MVESLKRSVEHLEPPSCAGCHVTMRWYHSVLVQPHVEIAHFFQCANCNRITEVRTEAHAESGSAPPPKLSQAERRVMAA